MDNDKEIEDLNKKLEAGFEEQAQWAEERLAVAQAAIGNSIKEILSIFSNDIRNLGIVAGTVAPFSLTLLGVEKLEINILALILGFSLLLITIGLTQYFLYALSDSHDRKLRKAEVSWIFAEIGFWEMKNTNNDTAKRTNGMFDYHKRIQEAERTLGTKALDPNILILRKKLSSYNLIAFLLLITGLSLILASVILNPVSEYLVALLLH